MRSRLSFCPTPSEIADERVLIPTVMRAQLIPPLLALTTALFLEPSIKAAEESPDAARLVAQTERAFSTRCAEVGIRDSFLEYFAPDAIHFAPEPRLARPDLEPKPSSNRVRLTWEPKIIRVANTGQLAVSTGPYVLKTADGESYGYFLSIWKRQPNADWRVAADIGVAGPQASNSNDDFQTYQDSPIRLDRLTCWHSNENSSVRIGISIRSMARSRPRKPSSREQTSRCRLGRVLTQRF